MDRGNRMHVDGSGQQKTLDELILSSFATSNALAKLLIEKSIITGAEFTAKVSAEEMIYQALLVKTRK